MAGRVGIFAFFDTLLFKNPRLYIVYIRHKAFPSFPIGTLIFTPFALIRLQFSSRMPLFHNHVYFIFKGARFSSLFLHSLFPLLYFHSLNDTGSGLWDYD
jgi:hypothetical protein